MIFFLILISIVVLGGGIGVLIYYLCGASDATDRLRMALKSNRQEEVKAILIADSRYLSVQQEKDANEWLSEIANRAPIIGTSSTSTKRVKGQDNGKAS